MLVQPHGTVSLGMPTGPPVQNLFQLFRIRTLSLLLLADPRLSSHVLLSKKGVPPDSPLYQVLGCYDEYAGVSLSRDII